MDYKPGDIANGHVLGSDNVWHPLAGNPGPEHVRTSLIPEPSSKVATRDSGTSGHIPPPSAPATSTTASSPTLGGPIWRRLSPARRVAVAAVTALAAVAVTVAVAFGHGGSRGSGVPANGASLAGSLEKLALSSYRPGPEAASEYLFSCPAVTPALGASVVCVGAGHVGDGAVDVEADVTYQDANGAYTVDFISQGFPGFDANLSGHL